LGKIGVQIPHPMYELEDTAFCNFWITKFFFPSKTLFNRSKPFSFSQQRTKSIPLQFALPLIHWRHFEFSTRAASYPGALMALMLCGTCV
jgi:hypothetical protein